MRHQRAVRRAVDAGGRDPAGAVTRRDTHDAPGASPCALSRARLLPVPCLTTARAMQARAMRKSVERTPEPPPRGNRQRALTALTSMGGGRAWAVFRAGVCRRNALSQKW
jgi:hypothetical protein